MSDSQNTHHDNHAAIENAEEIIQRFGGIRPMANKMRVPVTTVQGWKKRGSIPASRQEEILQAAADNGVDLSGILTDAAPSEAAEETGREGEAEKDVKAGTEQDGEETENQENGEEKHEDGDRGGAGKGEASGEPFVLSSAAPPETPPRRDGQERGRVEAGRNSATRNDDELLARMIGVEKKAIRQSIWATMALVAVAVAAGAFILWPAARKVETHERKITELERDVALIDGRVDDVEAKQEKISGLMPEGFNLGALQDKARTLQETVGALVDTADEVSRSFTESEGGAMKLGERVKRLEEQVDALVETPEGGFPDILSRVRGFGKSLEGRETLNRSIAQLNALAESMQGQMSNFDEALVVAREESDALGETFEGVSNKDLEAAAMLVTLSKVRETLNRGDEPFAEDLALLSKLAGDDDPELQAAIQKLAPHAEEGVLTTEGLSREFRSFAGDIVFSSLKGEDVSIKEKAQARVNEIFQVEKDGELMTGTETQAKVRRAEKNLQEGDIAGAISELQTLEGAAAQAAAPFLDKAQATLQAEKLKSMIRSLVRQHAGSGSNAPYTARMKGFSSFVPGKPLIRDEESGVTVMPE